MQQKVQNSNLQQFNKYSKAQFEVLHGEYFVFNKTTKEKFLS